MIDISELSKQTGIPAHTLRYYEKRGLISSLGRSGLKRTYADSVITTLNLIGLGKETGFTLDEISTVFNLTGIPEINRDAVLEKSKSIDEQINQLIKIKQILEHIAICPYSSHLECPSFQKILSGQRVNSSIEKP